MDHIRQFDWNAPTPDSQYFVEESDIDNSCIEKILQNKFYDPLADKPNEKGPKKKINWAAVFTQKNKCDNSNKKMLHVPGLKDRLTYPKLSKLSWEQHSQCLKVLCSVNPDILPTMYIQIPKSQDYLAYERLKQEYEEEQKEFQAWANSLWCSGHNIRALKPSEEVVNVYEAEFKMQAKELQCLPKNYEFDTQIRFEENFTDVLTMSCQKHLIDYDMRLLPQVKFPNMISKHLSILKQYPTPKPCETHPCKFILPNENSITELPLTEVNLQLAQYCLDNGCQIIASETALRCMLETDMPWMLLVNVYSVVDADGVKHNIVVLGSKFSNSGQLSTIRTYRAYRHLLYNTFVPVEERKRCIEMIENGNNSADDDAGAMAYDVMSDSSDDEDFRRLFIDFDFSIKTEPVIDDGESNMEINESNGLCDNDATKTNGKRDEAAEKTIESNNGTVLGRSEQNSESNKTDATDKGALMSECTCKDMFEKPFPRSYSKWAINRTGDTGSLNFIVHYSHKCRRSTSEVILEPIPEYQLDLGASAQSKEKIMSLAMMLYLRRESCLLNVRVDGQTGEVVCGESISLEELLEGREDIIEVATRRIYTALQQLSALVPGHYIMSHEPQHGLNALLYVATKVKNMKTASMTLDFNLNAVDEEKERKFLKTAPLLIPVLLPCHKYRNTLPLAFAPSPHRVEKQLAKETSNRPNTPPMAFTAAPAAEEGRSAKARASPAARRRQMRASSLPDPRWMSADIDSVIQEIDTDGESDTKLY